MNIKVLDKNGEGKEDDLINGMLWAKDHGADIINISAGIERDCDGSCRVCKTAKSIAKEIPICAAAGNNPKVGSCPAQVGKPVISVGALDYGGKNVADYSYKGIVYMSGTFKMIPLDMQVGLEDEDLLS